MSSGGGLVSMFGTILGVSGEKQAGEDAEQQAVNDKAYADYKARQYKRNAGQARASAQRAAEDVGLETELVASRALAMMSAQGGASDPGSMRTLAKIESEGAYRESIALYQGETEAVSMEEQATGLEIGGVIALQGGDQAQNAARVRAGATLMQGVGSMMSSNA